MHHTTSMKFHSRMTMLVVEASYRGASSNARTLTYAALTCADVFMRATRLDEGMLTLLRRTSWTSGVFENYFHNADQLWYLVIERITARMCTALGRMLHARALTDTSQQPHPLHIVGYKNQTVAHFKRFIPWVESLGRLIRVSYCIRACNFNTDLCRGLENRLRFERLKLADVHKDNGQLALNFVCSNRLTKQLLLAGRISHTHLQSCAQHALLETLCLDNVNLNDHSDMVSCVNLLQTLVVCIRMNQNTLQTLVLTVRYSTSRWDILAPLARAICSLRVVQRACIHLPFFSGSTMPICIHGAEGLLHSTHEHFHCPPVPRYRPAFDDFDGARTRIQQHINLVQKQVQQEALLTLDRISPRMFGTSRPLRPIFPAILHMAFGTPIVRQKRKRAETSSSSGN